MNSHEAAGHLTGTARPPARPAMRPPRAGPAALAPARRWERAFAGVPESVRRARQWPREFLPPCDAHDDLETIACELAANAVQHTASGEPGGAFTMDISWWRASGSPGSRIPDFIRLVVGDQGGDTRPRLIRDADGERNRGLMMVDGLSARWGITGSAPGRWIWADVPWTARGGLPLAAPGGEPLARQELAALRHSHSDTRVWFSPSMHAWCGWPDTTNVPPVTAPSPRALTALLPATQSRQPGPAIIAPSAAATRY